MIVEDKGEVLEIKMVHNVVVGKRDPIVSFRKYLNQILKEFEHELARTVYPMMPPTSSHIIIP